MALDYNNLPLLMTIEEVAEAFRCSTGTIRRKLASDPGWLIPVRHGLMRRQLFATVDVMAHLGHAAPTMGAAPLKDVVSSWNPQEAEAALGDAVEKRRREQDRRRHDKHVAKMDEQQRRVSRQPAASRAQALIWNRKVKVEASDDWTSFRIRLHFQPRYRPPGWPETIAIPRAGPVWVGLATDAEAKAVQAEIDEVMAEYQPLWDRMVDDARKARAGRGAKKKPDA